MFANSKSCGEWREKRFVGGTNLLSIGNKAPLDQNISMLTTSAVLAVDDSTLHATSSLTLSSRFEVGLSEAAVHSSPAAVVAAATDGDGTDETEGVRTAWWNSYTRPRKILSGRTQNVDIPLFFVINTSSSVTPYP